VGGVTVPIAPVLFHSHGIGALDFSSMGPEDLEEIDRLAAARDVFVVPTIVLRREYVAELRRVMLEFSAGRAQGRYERILGFGVEGPLLGLSSSMPMNGCWLPTAAEWRELAALGRLGLVYVVMAPDAVELHDEIDPGLRFRDVIDAFYRQGTRLALGHFQHGDPELSARRTQAVIDYIQVCHGPSPTAIITDHLYNDMPRELSSFLTHEWTDADLSSLLGPVPATLLRAAARGQLTPMLNFDGDHVDLEICRRTVEYLGSERLIATGSGDAAKHAENMRQLGCTEHDIANLLAHVAMSILMPAAAVTDDHVSLVEDYLTELAQLTETVNARDVGRLIGAIVAAVKDHRTVLLGGNGGSASAATHMVSDWSRAAASAGVRPVRIVGLADNVATITGLANDIGFEDALACVVQLGAEPGDLLVLLSVSGASPNLLNAARAAASAGMEVVALVGQPGPLVDIAHHWAAIGVGDYGLVEDLQVAVNHMVVRALSSGTLPGDCAQQSVGSVVA
jgi:phosphoheptose isomerase